MLKNLIFSALTAAMMTLSLPSWGAINVEFAGFTYLGFGKIKCTWIVGSKTIYTYNQTYGQMDCPKPPVISAKK